MADPAMNGHESDRDDVLDDALKGVRLAALEALNAGATLVQTQLECAEAWAVRRRVGREEGGPTDG